MKMFWPVSYPLLIEYEAERNIDGVLAGDENVLACVLPALIEYEAERE